jgi:hypothetical protein
MLAERLYVGSARYTARDFRQPLICSACSR